MELDIYRPVLATVPTMELSIYRPLYTGSFVSSRSLTDLSTYQQRNFRREVDKFRAVGYRPVYKLNRVQSCPRADILSLSFFYYETLDNANTIFNAQ